MYSNTTERTAQRVRRKLGKDAFRILLYLMETDTTNIQIARMFHLKNWQVSIWRTVLTEPSRKIIPELQEEKARVTLRLAYSKLDEVKQEERKTA